MSPVYVALLITILAVCCVHCSDNKINEHKAWHHNFKTASQFTCKLPQPRAVQAEELLKGQVGTAERIMPTYTVLHRCDAQSGCCLIANQECSVASSEPVTVVFQKIGISEKSFVSVTAYNHTRCACLPRNDQPKRLQWLEMIPDQVEITSGQATIDNGGFHLFLFGCVICLLFISVLTYAI